MRTLVACAIFSVLICQAWSAFNCFDCTGGPDTNCGYILSRDMVDTCSTQCYEAYILYQNGALPLVQRRCWTKPKGTTATNFCQWFNSSQIAQNSNAKLITCSTCNSDRCNGNKNLVTRTTVKPIPGGCSK
ncbi:unnamed protein product [Phyllotreta striolata]|uniref:Protein quiver n=1 Tax=Phyllotreta striolata TaxID=444603 RepID=A0A9N9U1W7_PHYSR|nr:unnamed protein product [Phyllotreta striolata]